MVEFRTKIVQLEMRKDLGCNNVSLKLFGNVVSTKMIKTQELKVE